MVEYNITDKVDHPHQMVTGLWELLHLSTATVDTPDLHQAQELACIQEIGMGKIQHAIEVMRIQHYDEIQFFVFTILIFYFTMISF